MAHIQGYLKYQCMAEFKLSFDNCWIELVVMEQLHESLPQPLHTFLAVQGAEL